jgi:hypothetical protein
MAFTASHRQDDLAEVGVAAHAIERRRGRKIGSIWNPSLTDTS